MMKLEPAERRLLEDIYRQMRELEAQPLQKDQNFDPERVEKIKSQLKFLAGEKNPVLVKVSEIHKHLHPEMSLQHLMIFLVPLERILQKNIQDDDFLVREGDLSKTTPHQPLPLVMVLHNIRSAFNVGSILRTAECLKIAKVYLCGYTPLPNQEKIAKTALGTQDLIPWEERPQITELLKDLKSEGYQLIALETAEKSIDLYSSFPHQPTALIVGNERFGLDPEILKAVDQIRNIPLRGQKNSLNVGVSLAIAGFEWSRQWAQT